QMRELTPDDLVIADAERPVAIAGVMGGEESEVGPETTEVLLEAANFEQLGVLRTSERLHLRSEASTRWEKGVDPYAAEQAAVYATELLVQLCGARFTGHTDVHGGLPEAYTYSLRPDDPDPRALELPEPLSAVQRVLRTTLVPSLVDAARANVDRGNEGVALFEVAHVYLPAGGKLPEERWRVAGI